MTYIIISFVALIIAILLARWIFGISTITRNLEIQTHILEKMAKQSGLADSEIKMKDTGFFDH